MTAKREAANKEINVKYIKELALVNQKMILRR
jgi:hypothetical protein